MKYLVFLAGWSRWLNQLLQDPEAHEGNVLHNNRCFDVYSHEEKTESWVWRRQRPRVTPTAQGVPQVLADLTSPQPLSCKVPAPIPNSLDSPQRKRSSQQLSSFEMESVSKSISY